MTARRSARGELAIVLHTHMPYVEGFDTWPFGEEWLWEAIATSYVPLLDHVLGRAPITLSLTPVLCDQLEAPGAVERCIAFLREIRPESHARDIAHFEAHDGDQSAARYVEELRRSQAEYAAVADRLEQIHEDTTLLHALGSHATWTSSATHAVLPLLATDSGINLQLNTGIAGHRTRFDGWDGGFWLPECVYAPWLDLPLHEAGARATCVELTNAFGLGDPRHLTPLQTDEGPVLWPIDRATVDLVWGAAGYPSHGAYRNYHALTDHHHRVWGIDRQPSDYARATEQPQNDARDFVERVTRRVDDEDGGVCVFAIDTELLGHWWYEGVLWLSAVIDEAAAAGLPLTTLDDALTRHEPAPAPAGLPVSSWGTGGDLRTWSGPASAELAWQARTAELQLLAQGQRPTSRALRELLALQSSDWAFLETHAIAGDYPRERAAGHADELARALTTSGGDQELRNLAPHLSGWDG